MRIPSDQGKNGTAMAMDRKRVFLMGAAGTVGNMLNYLVSLSSDNNLIGIEIDESRVGTLHADLQVPDTSRVIKHKGWKAEIPFERTIRDLLEYWRGRIGAGRESPCR